MADLLISANDFMQLLKDNSLLIVSAKDFEMAKVIQRRKMMKRTSLSLSEIIKAGFFPVKDSKTLIDWCKNGKIKESEWYQEEGGKKRIMVLTHAIKRLGHDE